MAADQMLNYVHAHNLISKHQHRFMSRHSTVSNLLESVNDWTLALNYSKGIAVAYIDYAKAFDVVCHSKLLLKLSAYGIRGARGKGDIQSKSDNVACRQPGACAAPL